MPCRARARLPEHRLTELAGTAPERRREPAPQVLRELALQVRPEPGREQLPERRGQGLPAVQREPGLPGVQREPDAAPLGAVQVPRRGGAPVGRSWASTR